jgi:hypothetical protein
MRNSTKHKQALANGTARMRYLRADLDEVIRLHEEDSFSVANAILRVQTLTKRIVPAATVYRYIREPDRNSRPGPPPLLTKVEEERLVSFFFKMAALGVGLSLDEAGSVIVNMLNDGSTRRNPYKTSGSLPGDDFWTAFFARHPDVSQRAPEALKKTRAKQERASVYAEFYDLLEGLHAANKYLPRNIWNDDETMAKFKTSRVISRRGEGTVYVLEDTEWPHITVLACISAAGERLPPLIIHSAKSILLKWTFKEGIAGTTYSATETGWIDRKVYLEWFRTVYVPHVNATRGTNEDGTICAVLLVFDGHDSHIGLEVALLAEQHSIDLLQMPSHTSHRLQPLDVSCFYSWHNELHKQIKRILRDHPYLNITRDQFSELMGPAFKSALSPENIKAGFLKSGIWPIDRTKIVDKLTSNEASAVLSPAVALDPRPNSVFLAPAPVPAIAKTSTPTRTLVKLGKEALRSTIVQHEDTIHDLKMRLAVAESARLDALLRLPLRDVTNAPATTPQARRSVSALRSTDGRARVLTAEQLQAILDEQDAKKAAEEDAKQAAKDAKTAAKAAAKAGKPTRRRRSTKAQVQPVLVAEIDASEGED